MGKIVSLESLDERLEALRAEIETARAALDAKISEFAEMEAAKKIVLRYGVDDGKADSRPATTEQRLPLNDAAREMNGAPVRMTKRQLFINILQQAPSPWVTAKEIQTRAKAITGKDYPMKSVSPMLSDMKNAGEIVRDDLKVALKSRIERESPAV
jgi:hypothetical protein